MTIPSGFLDGWEYAERRGCSYDTIQRKRREGVIDSVKIRGKHYFDPVICDLKIEDSLSDTANIRTLQTLYARCKYFCKTHRYAIIITILFIALLAENIITRPGLAGDIRSERHAREAAESEAAYFAEAFTRSAKVLGARIGYMDVAEELGEDIDQAIARQWDEAITIFLAENPGAELPEFSFADQTEYIARLLSEKMEEDRQAAAYAEEQASYIPSAWPLEVHRHISSGFGSRYVARGSVLSRLKGYFSGWELHKGVDITAPRGTAVLATAPGDVVSAGSKSGYGNVVIIQHGDTYTTLYAHLNTIRVRAGDQVKRGDIIGTVGTTGTSTGPHLHYEIHVNEIPVNPGKYLKGE